MAHFSSLLPLCRKVQHFNAFSSLLIVHGFIGRHPLTDHFIRRCCLLGFPDSSLPPFRSIPNPSLFLQNLLLKSLSAIASFESIALVYQKCRNSGTPSDNYTYPAVIKACASLLDVRAGKTIHCCAFVSGFCCNLVVRTAVLDFYARAGEIGDAYKVFDEIPQPDLVAWNALISGYSFNGLNSNALQIFKRMYAVGVKPNASTFASIFPVCSRVRANVIGFSLHGLSYKLGCNEDESLAPALITMYATCGDIFGAGNAFNALDRKDVVVWNAMLSSYTRWIKPWHALAAFRTMLGNGVKPNAVTFLSLVPSSEHLGNVYYVDFFLVHVLKYGFEKEVSVATTFISAYGKFGDLNLVESLFRNLQSRNLLAWNSMVSAYAGQGLWGRSLDVFHLMQMDGFVPDAISIVSLVSSCSGSNTFLSGKSAHAFTIRKGIDSNLVASNAMLAFYCRNGDLVYAFRVFDSMHVKDIVSWNTMISGCVDNEESQNAMLVFHWMRQEGINFDLVTLISILPCYKGRNLMSGLAIHSYSVKTALAMDISLANALISMYINCEDLVAARLVFDEMPDKCIVSWNAIITGYRLHNLSKEVIELFCEMLWLDQEPNYVTFLNVLPVCRTHLQGKSIHAYVIRRMIPLEAHLLTSLLIMYGRFKNLPACLVLFHSGDKKNVSLWNGAISIYLLLQNGAAALSLFREMLRDKIELDDVTALNVASACAIINDLRISNLILAYLVRMGFDKNVALSNTLIALYAKCGSISDAKTIFDAMPEKDTISWGVMINAYGLHGDIKGAMSVYSQVKQLGLKLDKVTYMSILSACSHTGCVEEGMMVFNSMISEGIEPGVEHYGCLVDLLGRTGHLNEAYQVVKGLPSGSHMNMLKSLLGACLSHGEYMLGEEVGRSVLEMKPDDSETFVILHNIYAAAGKWDEADNVRRAMVQGRVSKAPGISVV